MDEVMYLIFGGGQYDSDGIDIIGYVRGESAAQSICRRLNAKNNFAGYEYKYMEIDDLSKEDQ